MGLAEDKSKLILEPFRQADGSITRKYGGTGLGLAICSSLVELMGGAISVTSKLGQGSTFSFTTRCAVCDSPQKMTEPGKSPSPHCAIGRLRILLAEDNRVNQLLTIRLLEGQGHEVVVVNHGRAALEVLERESFDFVLMDIQIPEMAGLEATSILRPRSPSALPSV